jgi:putative glutamine amidotransferase
MLRAEEFLTAVALLDPMGSPGKAARYPAWLRRWIPDADVRVLSCTQQNAGALAECGGLVLSGGNDIDPRLYHRPDLLHLAPDVHQERDTFELKILEAAMRLGMPILGICRGMQLCNVFLGGSLIPDVELAGHPGHRGDGGDCRHGITIEPGSQLHKTTGLDLGEVNSSHHQAVDVVGRGLCVAARSTDGIIESLEWLSPAGEGHLQLVQWHPERMDDTDNPLTRNIILQFTEALQRNTTTRGHV